MDRDAQEKVKACRTDGFMLLMMMMMMVAAAVVVVDSMNVGRDDHIFEDASQDFWLVVVVVCNSGFWLRTYNLSQLCMLCDTAVAMLVLLLLPGDCDLNYRCSSSCECESCDVMRIEVCTRISILNLYKKCIRIGH